MLGYAHRDIKSFLVPPNCKRYIHTTFFLSSHGSLYICICVYVCMRVCVRVRVFLCVPLRVLVLRKTIGLTIGKAVVSRKICNCVYTWQCSVHPFKIAFCFPLYRYYLFTLYRRSRCIVFRGSRDQFPSGGPRNKSKEGKTKIKIQRKRKEREKKNWSTITNNFRDRKRWFSSVFDTLLRFVVAASFFFRSKTIIFSFLSSFPRFHALVFADLFFTFRSRAINGRVSPAGSVPFRFFRLSRIPERR